MQLRELKIEISEELLESLKKASEDQHITEEKLAGQLLENALKAENKEEKKPTMPGVALIKNNFVPENTPETSVATMMQKNTGGLFAPSAAAPAPAKLQRRAELEARMKEVSLLINTAENEGKREEYVQVYAQLAAELDALL